jgi:hypothetical protein
VTNQETITDDASPDDEAEQGWLRVLDRIKKLRTAIDGLADEVEEVFDPANPKTLQLMQHVQEDIEQATIGIEIARDTVFEW